ncbi:hypothetical protein Vretifemale_20316 [Volvox reticuliferus]|uniref:Uncharacterized protein n=1 Tax=Volvox reticuliferus TaxID=1737510 RepID=A0A8J4D4R3_9CHLO|nr:hypothetical protein Vretifemale_20316 [Volvox reticuliferus]
MCVCMCMSMCMRMGTCVFFISDLDMWDKKGRFFKWETSAVSRADQSRPGAAGTSLAVAASGGIGGTAAAAGPGETAFETLLSPLQWRAGGGIQPPTTSPASSSLASVAAGLGFSFPAVSGGGGGSGAAAATSAAAAIFGPSNLAGLSLTGILGFGVGGGSSATATTPGPPASGSGTPPLPVSSSAAAGPSSFSSSSTGPAAGGGGGGGGSSGGGVAISGVGAPLPPFLSSFLRPRLRPSLYTSAATNSGLPLEAVLPMTNVWLRGTNEWAQLLPYHRGQLLVLALLHDGPPPGVEVLAALAAVLGRGAGPAAAALSAEVPARSIWHEKGNRYCYTDSLCHVAR